jgi:hypothetical protein
MLFLRHGALVSDLPRAGATFRVTIRARALVESAQMRRELERVVAGQRNHPIVEVRATLKATDNAGARTNTTIAFRGVD